jgi:hypothetical protein
VAVFLGADVVTSLLPAIVAGVLLVGIATAPDVRVSGTIRLRTDGDPDSVVDALTGPTPLRIPLRWKIADEIDADGATAASRTSYLLWLREATTTVRSRTGTGSDGIRRVEPEPERNAARGPRTSRG